VWRRQQFRAVWDEFKAYLATGFELQKVVFGIVIVQSLDGRLRNAVLPRHLGEFLAIVKHALQSAYLSELVL
jgi:hypothetical protein